MLIKIMVLIIIKLILIIKIIIKRMLIIKIYNKYGIFIINIHNLIING